MADPPPVESIDRALLVITALAGAGAQGASLSTLCNQLGLTKATMHRTLAALRFRDFAAQDPVSSRYVLGPTAARLADAFFGEENLPVLLHPALVALCERTNELVHLGVLSGTHVVYLDKIEPQRAVRVWSEVGRRMPAVTTALGRAMLAFRGTTRAGLDAYLGAAGAGGAGVGRGVSAGAAEGSGADGVFDGVAAEHVWQAILRTRHDGYATEQQENEPGISCVAVPLLRNGTAVAAVSATGPADRLTPERLQELGKDLRAVLPTQLPQGLTLP